MTLASFLSSGTQHAILNGLGFFAFVLWLSLGYWTYKDARRRIVDPLLIVCAVVLALIIPFRESATCGLCYIFVPFYGLYYLITRWQDMKYAFGMSFLGALCLI